MKCDIQARLLLESYQIQIWYDSWQFGMNIILQFLQHIVPSSISICTCIKSIALSSYVELAQTVGIIKLNTLLL